MLGLNGKKEDSRHDIADQNRTSTGKGERGCICETWGKVELVGSTVVLFISVTRLLCCRYSAPSRGSYAPGRDFPA